MSAHIQQVPDVDHSDKFGYALEIGEEIVFCLDAIRCLNDEVIYKENVNLFHALSLAIYRIEMLTSDLERLSNGEEPLYGSSFSRMMIKQ